MNKLLSDCCSAEVVVTHACDNDAGDNTKKCLCSPRGTTKYYSCTACNKPCDWHTRSVAVTFETATPEQKKELIRECVKEANQDQRDTYELEKLIKEAEKKFRY